MKLTLFFTISLLILNLKFVEAQVRTVGRAEYFQRFQALSDEALIKHFSKQVQFGSKCQFLESPQTNATCKYIVEYDGNMVCLTTGLSGTNVIGLGMPSSSSASSIKAHIEAATGIKSIYSSLVINPQDVDKLAATLIRNEFLKDSNPCLVAGSQIPADVNRSINEFTSHNVKFYKPTEDSSEILCKTNLFSKNLWDTSSCSYQIKDAFISPKICKLIYSRLEKKATQDNPAPLINLASSADLKEFLQTQVEQKGISFKTFSAKPLLVNSIPAAQLQAIQYKNSSGEITASLNHDQQIAVVTLNSLITSAPATLEKTSYLNIGLPTVITATADPSATLNDPVFVNVEAKIQAEYSNISNQFSLPSSVASLSVSKCAAVSLSSAPSLSL